MESSSTGSVTAALSLREHLVDELVFARSPEGRWPALCGALVVSADMGAPPTGQCGLCAESARGRR